MNLTPYLFFTDNCREALNFYNSCFRGDLQLMTYGDAQGEACQAAMKDKIMHGAIVKDGFLLMASDSPERAPSIGSNVHLSLNCASLDEIETLFKALSVKGKVTYPLHDTFWGARFGTLVDQFGFHWMLNFDKNKK